MHHTNICQHVTDVVSWLSKNLAEWEVQMQLSELDLA